MSMAFVRFVVLHQFGGRFLQRSSPEDRTAGLSEGAAPPDSRMGGGGATVGVGISAETVALSALAGGASETRNCWTVEMRSRLSDFGTTFRTPTFCASSSTC